jgi:hypothetical protein
MRRRVAALLLVGLGSACSGGTEEMKQAICPSASWKSVFTNLDRSALSLWGSGSDDVYAVGGGLGKGDALVLHWDGKSWRELMTGRSETLWWVWGTSEGTDVWTVGEKGLILRWDGATFTTLDSGTTAALYGVWGSAPDDVWIVGGVPGPEGGPDDVVLHWDGHALAPVALPKAKGAALFKVWGSGSDQLWITGEAGTVWHKDGSAWIDESAEIATGDTLSAVHGCSASEVYTVGGRNVYRFDGSTWQRTDAPIEAVAAGVACGPEAVIVVGSGGLKLRFDKAIGAWSDDTLAEPYNADFHGAYAGADGSLWAAGGNYIAPASQIDQRIGVVAYYGCGVPR